MFDEETKEQRKERINRELAQKGFLPINEEFDECMRASVEDVEKQPRKYIIEECVPACEELWSKNIYTWMASNHEDVGCWISLVNNGLSDENKEILEHIKDLYTVKVEPEGNSFKFRVDSVGIQGQTLLLEFAKQLKMQDVPYGEAYITLEDYLIKCGCYTEITNPNYIPMADPFSIDLPVEQFGDYLIRYNEWESSEISKETIKVFDPSKIVKPLEEYFAGTAYIYDGDRVYMSQYHYNKHLNYLNSLDNIPGRRL